MPQVTVRELAATARLGIRHAAGPIDDRPVLSLDVGSLADLAALPAGCLAIVAEGGSTPPYQLDVALRRASASGLAGLVLGDDEALPETVVALADRGGVPVFSSHDVRPAELAVAIDRMLSGGASEAMVRASQAIAAASEVAGADGAVDDVLAAAGGVLGVALRLEEDAVVVWSASDAVCIGEVPIGRLAAAEDDPAAEVAIPSLAALLSRVAQRRTHDRFAAARARADLVVQLVLAESSRAEGFTPQAARLGLRLDRSHAAAWLTATSAADPGATAPRGVDAALELFALQHVEGRDEQWHVTHLQGDLLVVATEDPGRADHQRRLREVGERLQQHARDLVGPGWEVTLGLGTPHPGATGLRLSASEARIAAEAAVAADRPGGVEVTDITGLRRVLLDFSASPISRTLLGDILEPLDALGPKRAATAVRTLLAYLSNERSPVHTGRELTLHPNAVRYRLAGIRDALGLDLDDADVRFAVELACRVRLLGGR